MFASARNMGINTAKTPLLGLMNCYLFVDEIPDFEIVTFRESFVANNKETKHTSQMVIRGITPLSFPALAGRTLAHQNRSKLHNHDRECQSFRSYVKN
jgi:hypothetical protein